MLEGEIPLNRGIAAKEYANIYMIFAKMKKLSLKTVNHKDIK